MGRSCQNGPSSLVEDPTNGITNLHSSDQRVIGLTDLYIWPKTHPLVRGRMGRICYTNQEPARRGGLPGNRHFDSRQLRASGSFSVVRQIRLPETASAGL